MIKLRRRPESFGMSYVLVQNKIAFLLNQHRLTIACFYNQRNKNLIVNGIYQNWATVRKKKSIIHPGRSFLTIEPHPFFLPPPPPPHSVSSRTPCGFFSEKTYQNLFDRISFLKDRLPCTGSRLRQIGKTFSNDISIESVLIHTKENLLMSSYLDSS